MPYIEKHMPKLSQDQAFETKTCPRCKELLFADMDICYGCLYDFTRPASPAELLPPPEGQPQENPSSTALQERNKEDATLELEGLPHGVSSKTYISHPSPYLIRIVSPGMSLSLPLPMQGLVIGRSKTADVCLDARAVSRKHLALIPCETGVRAINLGATNPATFEGREIENERMLGLGESVDVCGVAFMLLAAMGTGVS